MERVVPVRRLGRDVMIARGQRAPLSFRSINRRGDPGHDPALQRHHLLPRQILSKKCFAAMIEAVGGDRLGLEDFRVNGLFLPSTRERAIRLRLPLHRGPHSTYNAMVIDRLGQIEAGWSRERALAPDRALEVALMRVDLLQRALRRRLLASDRRRLRLNRTDPLGTGLDFTDLDAMADMLWAQTGSSQIANGLELAEQPAA